MICHCLQRRPLPGSQEQFQGREMVQVGGWMKMGCLDCGTHSAGRGFPESNRQMTGSNRPRRPEYKLTGTSRQSSAQSQTASIKASTNYTYLSRNNACESIYDIDTGGYEHFNPLPPVPSNFTFSPSSLPSELTFLPLLT
jgi:hypothetical protein